MRAAGSPLQRRAERKWLPQGRPRSGSPGPISNPWFATRSDRLKDEVRLQAGFLCAPRHRTQKDGFELAAVIGEVTKALAKNRIDLRHIESELAALVVEEGAIAR